jgi:hypothetical protein
MGCLNFERAWRDLANNEKAPVMVSGVKTITKYESIALPLSQLALYVIYKTSQFYYIYAYYLWS